MLELEGARLLERYLVRARIGGGGFADVYDALDERLAKAVVVKVQRLVGSAEQQAVLLARFKREAEVLGRIAHPHVAQVLDLGRVAGRPFMVQEHVPGPSARDILKAGPLPVERVLLWARQAAAGLAGAHAVEVFHRDMKPENLVVAHLPGLGDWVKVVDFGIAAWAEATPITEHGKIFGTPGHLAPERTQTSAANPRTEVYEWASSVFLLLTGREPFVRRELVQVLLAKLSEPAPRVRSLRPDVPEAVDEFLDRCLQQDPSRRPADMEEVIEFLDGRAAPAASEPALRLTLLSPPEPARVFELVGAYHLLGRQSAEDGIFPSVDLTALDGVDNAMGVSRRHCELHHRPEGWRVVDLSSANGTRVGGAKVQPARPHPVDAGQELRVGALKFRVDVVRPG